MRKKFDNFKNHLTVEQISRILSCPYEGDGSKKIYGVSSLEKAKEGDLVFVTNEKYFPLLQESRATAAIIPKEQKYEKIPVIKSENPYLSFIKIVDFFWKPYKPEPGIHPLAFVSKSAKIEKDVSIGALTYVGEETEIGEGTVVFPLVCIYPRVKIGKQALIHSFVSLREGVRIGNRVIIHNGAVLGSDGFGYIKTAEGEYVKIPQKGTVVIEDEVEIGANTTIDRATLEETVIRKGTKIDNLVQIAHNVEIGENTILAGQVGIAGSTKVGKNVVMGGQVGVADHIKIGENVSIAAKSGITKNVPPHSFVAGSPHLEIKEWRKVWASLPQLYDLIKEVRSLKKKIEELEKKLA